MRSLFDEFVATMFIVAGIVAMGYGVYIIYRPLLYILAGIVFILSGASLVPKKERR